MLRLTIPLILSTLFLISFGCEKDNFEIVEETPETTDPTVVETEENYVSFRAPSGAMSTQVGTGLINEEGVVALATAENATAECLEGGTFSLTTEGGGLALGFISESQEVFYATAYGVEGAPDAEAFTVPGCGSTTLELTTMTDEQAAGTAGVEFFTINPDVPGFDCESLISLGVFEIEFNVGLVACN